MNPSLWNSATACLRFIGATLVTLALLLGTALLVAYSAAWLRGGDWISPSFIALGIVCALITWLFVAFFHLRPETQTFAFSQRKQFILKAKSVLQNMGYTLTSHRANSLTFWPGCRSYLLGGGIQIEANEQEAQLIGPKIFLDLFRRNFRRTKHVQRVHQYLDTQRKFTENMLKRVELQLRVEPEQFESVRTHVIKLLQKKGIVICELNVLVQSDKGIEENLVELEIRDWLEQNNIDCDIRKDVIQFVEVVESELASDKAAP